MKKQMIQKLFGAVFLLAVMPVYSAQITVSIPPLAGIVAPLLDEGDELHVLLKPGVSPHGFQLKPSHLKMLHESDLVISVGTPVDAWLEKALSRFDAQVVEMSALPGIQSLPVRQGGLWEKSDHGHEDEHEEHAGHAADHADEANSVHDEHVAFHSDGHLWLSLKNARLLIVQVSDQLQRMKPESAAEIQRKTEAWLKLLDEVDSQIKTQLEPYRMQPFVVLHDAYQYFEKHYGLRGVGSIRLNPEIAPSLKRIQSVRERISEQGIRCVFKEPQFPAKRITAVVSGLNVKVGSLDPMGVYDKTGTLLKSQYLPYDRFLIQMADAMSDCLTAKGK